MKILLGLTALLAAAIVAFVFPDMKKILILIPFALLAVALFSGCGSFESSMRKLPDGRFVNLELNETGKFSNTTGKFGRLEKDDQVITAIGVDLRHSDPWFPNVSLKSDEAVFDLSTKRNKRPNPLAAAKTFEAPPAPAK